MPNREASDVDLVAMGANIRRLREGVVDPKTGEPMGVNELARRCGFHNGSHVSRLENAQQVKPSIQPIAAIARALGVTVDELIGGHSVGLSAPDSVRALAAVGVTDATRWPEDAAIIAQAFVANARRELSPRGWQRLLDHMAGALNTARFILESDRGEQISEPKPPRGRRPRTPRR